MIFLLYVIVGLLYGTCVYHIDSEGGKNTFDDAVSGLALFIVFWPLFLIGGFFKGLSGGEK